jgi:hypothetical protein
MRNVLSGLVIATAFLLTPLVSAANGDPVTIELSDSKDWQGKAGEQIRVVYKDRSRNKTVEGTLVRFQDGWLQLTSSGRRLAPIYGDDIVSVKRLGGEQPSDDDASSASEDPSDTSASSDAATSVASDTTSADGDEVVDESIRGTFLLPLTGMVGKEFRNEEIDAIVAQADAIGPGQTIVLEINSGGGYVAEWEMIRDSIYDTQKRHRVVAWVLDGTSAACSTSMACDVIVMKSRGHMGSVTTLMGAPSAPMQYQVAAAEAGMAHVLRKAGRSPKLAVPFKTGDHPTKSLLSYTKDPETGAVTWYQSLEGEVKMNRPGQVLGFDARQAVDCKLAIGIADTKEQLGQLLDQGGWRELGTGEKIHESWNDLAKRCEKSITLSRKEFAEAGGDAQGIRKRIKIVEGWLRWYQRAPNILVSMQFYPKAQLEQMLLGLREQLRALQEK